MVEAGLQTRLYEGNWTCPTQGKGRHSGLPVLYPEIYENSAIFSLSTILGVARHVLQKDADRKLPTPAAKVAGATTR